jgi:two-component system chemotaxis sensor kinase CheA
MLDDHPAWFAGRLKAVACVLVNCASVDGASIAKAEIDSALELSLFSSNGSPLLEWLDAYEGKHLPTIQIHQATVDADVTVKVQTECELKLTPNVAPTSERSATEEGIKFGRRAEDQTGTQSLKVDQAKIEVLMNLIGEMVVSKNALPYLAQRAEKQYGVHEMAREIKEQYAVINRIVEEMQGAIMQVRMMPVSVVFQRFPRLVRDISRKLGKEVNLVLEGEETEADKNIIEALADPLIHIVRNSLDHGLELPDVRLARNKQAMGTLTIRATQEADRVVIEIIDDGKGIDPEVIKRKAYEKGIINEDTLERISDRDAINLVFAAGFSTVETVSDLSGRGVGMDVVRTGVDKVNGDILLESEVGKGTCMRISLPLSMAVTNVMIVESDKQTFGVPMDHVVETVRIPLTAIRFIKHSKTAVLRERIVALKNLNELLELPSEPKANDDNELAVLVVRAGKEVVGLIVDEFRETVEVIQKPLTGVLSGLGAYSGSALMGDGSVLMVLNIKEII